MKNRGRGQVLTATERKPTANTKPTAKTKPTAPTAEANEKATAKPKKTDTKAKATRATANTAKAKAKAQKAKVKKASAGGGGQNSVDQHGPWGMLARRIRRHLETVAADISFRAVVHELGAAQPSGAPNFKEKLRHLTTTISEGASDGDAISRVARLVRAVDARGTTDAWRVFDAMGATIPELITVAYDGLSACLMQASIDVDTTPGTRLELAARAIRSASHSAVTLGGQASVASRFIAALSEATGLDAHVYKALNEAISAYRGAREGIETRAIALAVKHGLPPTVDTWWPFLEELRGREPAAKDDDNGRDLAQVSADELEQLYVGVRLLEDSVVSLRDSSAPKHPLDTRFFIIEGTVASAVDASVGVRSPLPKRAYKTSRAGRARDSADKARRAAPVDVGGQDLAELRESPSTHGTSELFEYITTNRWSVDIEQSQLRTVLARWPRGRFADGKTERGMWRIYRFRRSVSEDDFVSRPHDSPCDCLSIADAKAALGGETSHSLGAVYVLWFELTGERRARRGPPRDDSNSLGETGMRKDLLRVLKEPVNRAFDQKAGHYRVW